MALVLVIVLVGLVVLAGVISTVMVVSRNRGAIEPPRVSPDRSDAGRSTGGTGGAATGTAVLEPPVEVAPVAAPVEPEPEPVPEPEVVATAEPVAKARLRDRLGKTRAAFAGYVRGVAGRGIDDDVYDELEEALLLADVGIATTTKLLDAVRAQVAVTKAKEADEVVALLRSEIESLLADDVDRTLRATPGELTVWMFVGVNGVGKTTTIGKLAAQRIGDGQRVMLAAADTFRAAAGEQLTQWAARCGADIVRGDEGADPGAIVFDAMASATSKGVDLLLVDTAGRLHTKHNLMAELEKLRRIVDRSAGALHEVLLVIDATTGQNGLQQAKQFADAVDVTGIVLAIQAELGLPVKVVGIGETAGDLVEFDPAEFAAALFDTDD